MNSVQDHMQACGVPPFGNLRVKAYLSAHRSLSQITTSFIASYCQGIHRMRLITYHTTSNDSRKNIYFCLKIQKQKFKEIHEIERVTKHLYFKIANTWFFCKNAFTRSNFRKKSLTFVCVFSLLKDLRIYLTKLLKNIDINNQISIIKK